MKSKLVTALAVSTGNILGPLILFGGIGWALTQRYGSNKYVIIGIFAAFITSNLLIVTTTSKIMRLVSKEQSSKDSSTDNSKNQEQV